MPDLIREIKIGVSEVATQKALSHREAVLPLFAGAFSLRANFAILFFVNPAFALIEKFMYFFVKILLSVIDINALVSYIFKTRCYK